MTVPIQIYVQGQSLQRFYNNEGRKSLNVHPQGLVNKSRPSRLAVPQGTRGPPSLRVEGQLRRMGKQGRAAGLAAPHAPTRWELIRIPSVSAQARRIAGRTFAWSCWWFWERNVGGGRGGGVPGSVSPSLPLRHRVVFPLDRSHGAHGGGGRQ